MAAVSWDLEWDDSCLDKSIAADARRFDPSTNLLTAVISPDFHIHSALAAGTAVHDTRASAYYAFALLGRGKAEDLPRATSILRELAGDQDADEASPTFGLWGYYHEEPPRNMRPPDYNWADFIGTVLLIALLRDDARLDTDLKSRLRTAVDRAARCSIRRNVTMSYTNIAVMSTFLIVGAAELVGGDFLEKAAKHRLAAIAAAFDASGSFAEFNSPTYNTVALENFARMRTYWKGEANRALAARLERRCWEHVLNHWHAPSRQFGGPMSRCYVTDLRRDSATQAFLQKATGGKLDFYSSPDKLPGGASETAMADVRCPADLVERFLVSKPTTVTYRENYELSNGICPIQGSVWKTDRYLLGTINRFDMWNQRRNLVLRWTEAGESSANPPGRTAVIRVLKDGYDFSSATLVCVQNRGEALGVITFARRAGDKHVSLDRLMDGKFTASDLRFSLELTGLDPRRIPAAFDPDRGALLDLTGGLHLQWAVSQTLWGDAPLDKFEVRRDPKSGAVGLDAVLYKGPSRTFSWDEIRRAYLVFTLSVGDTKPSPLGPVLLRTEADGAGGSTLRAEWFAPSGKTLSVLTRADIPEVAGIYAAARESIDDVIVPIATPPYHAG